MFYRLKIRRLRRRVEREMYAWLFEEYEHDQAEAKQLAELEAAYARPTFIDQDSPEAW